MAPRKSKLSGGHAIFRLSFFKYGNDNNDEESHK